MDQVRREAIAARVEELQAQFEQWRDRRAAQDRKELASILAAWGWDTRKAGKWLN